MDTKAIAAISGATLLALTGTASAGPMNEMSAAAIMPLQTHTEAIAYRYWHHYRRYGYHHRYYHRYYGWNPGAAAAGTALGLATLPFALGRGGYYGYYPYYYYQ
ncbi:MAG: hypothetical protein ACREDD_03740 [Methylocella sp.]